MCVTQFTEYCNASRFQIDGGDRNFEQDWDDPDIEVRPGSWTPYRREDGTIYQAVYYRTDLKELKRLAKLGNPYAISHLSKL